MADGSHPNTQILRVAYGLDQPPWNMKLWRGLSADEDVLTAALIAATILDGNDRIRERDEHAKPR
jgi:hypothetical protein